MNKRKFLSTIGLALPCLSIASVIDTNQIINTNFITSGAAPDYTYKFNSDWMLTISLSESFNERESGRVINSENNYHLDLSYKCKSHAISKTDVLDKRCMYGFINNCLNEISHKKWVWICGIVCTYPHEYDGVKYESSVHIFGLHSLLIK